ncbi:MAG: MSMEG_4193 family putative phosphomutase [Acidobacteria bacterium]|nr:MSMEG_4193 family putative phosphomutase [Acidobacteriota bacterium]
MLLLLVRHALTEWTGERLSGWTPGIPLSGEGREQAAALAGRLRPLRAEAIYSSPIQRCRETARPIAAAHRLRVRARDGLGEVRYGEWEGRRLEVLARTKAWRTVKHRPSAMRFPGGEAIREAQARGIEAVEEIARAHPRGVVIAVTHADLIRLLIAHHAGIHLDLYQRLAVAPASVSVLQLGEGVPRVVALNDTGDLCGLARKWL